MKNQKFDLGARMENQNEIKSCIYPGCENTIPAQSEFDMCEVCRTLSVRNALTITLDPTSPITPNRDSIFHTAIHNMRPEEIITAVQKMEWAYLTLQKTLKSREMEAYRQSRFEASIAEAMEQREYLNNHRAPKAEKKKESKQAKLEKLLGSKDAVKDILGEDFSDL